MRTIKTQVFNIKELDPSVQQRVRSNYIENMHDWHDGVLDGAGQIATYLGFHTCNIAYTGFWSQGDGASYTGSWYRNSLDRPKLASYAPVDEELRRIAEELAKAPDGLRVDISRSGRYCHEHSMDFQFYEDDEYADDQTPIVEAFRSFARWIYRQLDKEYESITTDEAIDEALQDAEFFADGRKYYGEDDAI